MAASGSAPRSRQTLRRWPMAMRRPRHVGTAARVRGVVVGRVPEVARARRGVRVLDVVAARARVVVVRRVPEVARARWCVRRSARQDRWLGRWPDGERARSACVSDEPRRSAQAVVRAPLPQLSRPNSLLHAAVPSTPASHRGPSSGPYPPAVPATCMVTLARFLVTFVAAASHVEWCLRCLQCRTLHVFASDRAGALSLTLSQRMYTKRVKSWPLSHRRFAVVTRRDLPRP